MNTYTEPFLLQSGCTNKINKPDGGELHFTAITGETSFILKQYGNTYYTDFEVSINKKKMDRIHYWRYNNRK